MRSRYSVQTVPREPGSGNRPLPAWVAASLPLRRRSRCSNLSSFRPHLQDADVCKRSGKPRATGGTSRRRAPGRMRKTAPVGGWTHLSPASPGTDARPAAKAQGAERTVQISHHGSPSGRLATSRPACPHWQNVAFPAFSHTCRHGTAVAQELSCPRPTCRMPPAPVPPGRAALAGAGRGHTPRQRAVHGPRIDRKAKAGSRTAGIEPFLGTQAAARHSPRPRARRAQRCVDSARVAAVPARAPAHPRHVLSGRLAHVLGRDRWR